MDQETSQTQNGNGNGSARQDLWLAGAVGAAAGVAALIARGRRESRWEMAQRRAMEVADDARKQLKPWMGIAAGAAAGGATLAYKLRHKPTRWETARRRASDVADQCGEAIQPWMSLVASTALSAVALARSRKQQRRAVDLLQENAGPATDQLVAAGARLLKRVQKISGDTKKLVPSVRRLIA